MPAENRVGCEDCTDLLQHLATQKLAFDRQSPALIIVEQNAFLTELFPEHLILSSQVG
jgi:hypothetical protein